MILTLLSFFFTCIQLQAAGSMSDFQVWNWTRKDWKSGKDKYSLQYQVRYSEDLNSVFEQQGNLRYARQISIYEIGFIYTYGSFKNFSERRESRYAIELQSNWKEFFGLRSFYRLRQEWREFKGDSGPSHRFRFLSGLKSKEPLLWNHHLTFTSEFNFYLNDTDFIESGFSSHRFILRLSPGYQRNPITWNYIYDFNTNSQRDLHRHILAFGLEF